MCVCGGVGGHLAVQAAQLNGLHQQRRGGQPLQHGTPPRAGRHAHRLIPHQTPPPVAAGRVVASGQRQGSAMALPYLTGNSLQEDTAVEHELLREQKYYHGSSATQPLLGKKLERTLM